MTRARARVRLTALACTGVAGLAVLAGCGSDGGTTTPTSAAPVTSTAGTPTTSDDPSSSAAPTASPTTPTTSPTSSSAPSSSPPSTPPSSSPPALAACGDLTVTATRVPGAAGVTFGLVTVTNRGSARCALPGVPALRLLDASRSPMTPLATAATSSGAATTLEPGGVGSTLLEDRSATCQANQRSTYVEVQATTAAEKVVLALALPPCSLSVKPFVPGSQPSP